MKIVGGTDVGNVRPANEDYYKIFKFNERSFCAVVADGMGGHKGGKVASTTAANIIVDHIRENIADAKNDDEIISVITRGVNIANEQIYIQSITIDELEGMGTTAVIVYCKDDEIFVANVGDSRLYVVKDTIHQVTKDHSYVQDLVDKGIIAPEEAATHPNKNLITKALGTEIKIEADFFKLDAEPGLKLVLCTDGLSNFVDDKTIEKTVKENSIEAANKILIDLAKENGGRDNITLINIEFYEVKK